MLTSIATRGASASPGAASASAARDRRQAITVAGMMQKDDGDLDEDDFLWEKLPGRCCVHGRVARRARPGRRKGKDAQAECERLFRGRDDATDITDATSAADDYLPGARAIGGRGPPPSLAPSVGPPKLRMEDERRGGAADDASRARRQLLD